MASANPPDAGPLAGLSRRRFLRWSALGLVTAATAGRTLWPARLPEGLAPLQHLSSTEAAVLAAAYEVVTDDTDPASRLRALARMDAFVGSFAGRLRLELKGALLLAEHSPLLFQGYLRRFSALDPEQRAHCLERWQNGFVWGRPVFGAIKELTSLARYSDPASWEAIGYSGPLVPPTSERPWTETDRAYEKLRAPIPKEGDIVEVDVAVVGSGAGGAAAAWAVARRGLKVAILEAGEHLLPRDLSQREDEMYPRLFYDGGGRRTANRAIRVLHGHGVGGSTLHNINLCKRAPDELLRHWAIPGWGPEELRPYYEQVERLLDVRPIELAWVNKANGRIRDGVK
ncbi:MAG: GMC family oxidoreductase N-terminal domain-containing protein, partial [Bdellovibrionales bacterium]|nr:GMC family oxidoreductase N-terminal domain-containing protein [Bdellovibrionales bacterium]